MKLNMVLLGELITEQNERLAQAERTIYSVTNDRGFIPSLEVFGKQVFSADTSSYKIADFKDLAYNPSRINVGSVALCLDPQGGAVSPMYTIVRCRHNLSPEFLLYFLKSPRGLAEINNRTEGAVRFQLRFRDLQHIPIYLPPLREQERLVGILDEAQTLCNLRAQADSRTANFTPALFQQMFGNLAHLDQLEWRIVRLDSVSSISYGLADKLDANMPPAKGTRIMTISNVLLDGSLDLSVQRYSLADVNTRARARLAKFDLLFNWRNGSKEHVGKTALWENQVRGEVLHVSFLLRIRPDPNRVSPYFLWVLLNQLRSNGFFTRASRFEVNTKFNATELSALQLPLPPLPLQQEFADSVVEIRAMQDRQARSHQWLDDLSGSLTSRAFAGAL